MEKRAKRARERPTERRGRKGVTDNEKENAECRKQRKGANKMERKRGNEKEK